MKHPRRSWTCPAHLPQGGGMPTAATPMAAKAAPAPKAGAYHGVPGKTPNSAGQTGHVPVRGIVQNAARYR